MRRTLAIAALVVALGAGSHADACWLWARLRPRRLIQLCSRGHAPVVVDRTVPPRGDLPPNTQPPLPVSDYHEVVALVPDPQNPGYFLYRVRRGPNADLPRWSARPRSTLSYAATRSSPRSTASAS